MQIATRYSAVAIWLHWLLAITLSFQIGLGFAMPEGAKGFALIQLHKSVGITVLLLTVCRIAWRLLRTPPPALDTGWQTTLAKTVHAGLYVFMLLAPLSGWALVSTAPVEVPTVLFGKVGWPHLPLPHGAFEPAEQLHAVLAWAGAALVALHIAGALRHQLLLHDETLARIAPGGSSMAALGLLGLAALLFMLPFALSAPQPEKDRVASEAPVASAAPPATPTPSATPSPLATESAEPPDVAATETPANEPAAPPVWTIAPGGSLRFSVLNGDDRIAGRFDRWSGAIAFDPADPATAEIRIDVDLASATVADPTQDSMLRQADFLGPAGTATWRSTSVQATGPGTFKAQGRLSLKGQTKAVPLTFKLRGNAQTKSVTGTTSLDRTIFGIGSGEVAEALSPTVNVEFSFNATRN